MALKVRKNRAPPAPAKAAPWKSDPGPFQVGEDASITWHDAKRDRDVPVKLWFPEGTPEATN